MIIDIATLFPDMCERVVSESIIGRARTKGLVEINCHYIRDYTLDKHRRCDDAPYGGGMGLVMQADPIWRCYEQVCQMREVKLHPIYLTPQGKPLTQERCIELSKLDGLFLLCGHYEGVDERVIERMNPEEISIGDYVLTGGELPALVLTDAVTRLLDGVLSSSECFEEESHYSGLLEYPHYTRPEVWEDMQTPEILLSGHHANIDKWRREQTLIRTLKKRPDLLERASKQGGLTEEDERIVNELTKLLKDI
ncbi:MAG TPA: tRNA (guanosine(37)-N1)-methyltransferase TrmD [Oscillospiraceae bacterium]|nr:tRNA (guanosine(37)-N1)-methyltransferase TrmD [Oscillospiraceae bacterium]